MKQLSIVSAGAVHRQTSGVMHEEFDNFSVHAGLACTLRAHGCTRLRALDHDNLF